MASLKAEVFDTCFQSVWRLERHIKVHGTIKSLPRSARLTKPTNQTIKEVMLCGDGTSYSCRAGC